MRNTDWSAWDGGEDDRDCSLAHQHHAETGEQVSSDLDARGRELPDPVPMAPPVGMTQGPSLADFVQRMIRNEVSRRAAEAEMETFEESDDFEVEDDPLDPLTEYEAGFDRRIPEDWPMYFDPETGRSGQLPPNEAAPPGFVRLERERVLPKGFQMPQASPPDGVTGGAGGAEPPKRQTSSEPPGSPREPS